MTSWILKCCAEYRITVQRKAEGRWEISFSLNEISHLPSQAFDHGQHPGPQQESMHRMEEINR